MNRLKNICAGLVVLIAAPLWSQVDTTPVQPVPAFGPAESTAETNSDGGSDRMLTPPPVSGQAYPSEPSSEDRSNYLRGGLSYTTAYTDNAQGSLNGHPVSDVSFSVSPYIALAETTARMLAVFSYAPGFTFYRRTSSLNQADQNASIDFQYRLSPHVTFSARDGFQKTSSVFNQPSLSAEAVSGGAQQANFSIIAPIADVLRNAGNIGLSYQFARNGLVGASGTFSNLHYPNPAQVPGLYDSSSQSGSAFYSFRISKMHYIGTTYQYQRLLSYPTHGLSETQTHALLLFYTLYPTKRFSISFFGGPQHSDTFQAPLPPLNLEIPEVREWSPAAGASFSWQERLTNIAMSYSHIISGGGGLISAVKLDSATASVSQQITKNLSGTVGAGYAQNNVLGSPLNGSSNGHSISATASLQRQFHEHFNLQLGYTRLHQNYSSVAVIAMTPDTNREFVAVSYQFSRPLGR
jgi:hypothetical protein